MIRFGILVLLIAALLSQACSKSTRPPNVVLIYIDDLGYSDISGYGKEYGNTLTETPNIDRFMTQGMKFTQAYAAAPLCSPSRAALLTGKSPARLNFEFVTKYEDTRYPTEDDWADQWAGKALLPPRFTLDLPVEEVTMAEMLKEAGYETAICGKWHVAAHHRHYLGWSPTHGPRQQGFDYAAETFGSHPYRANREPGRTDASPGQDAGQYPKDELTDEAIKFIRRDHDRPFFLFVSHYYVHTPLDTLANWLSAKYKKKGGPGLSASRVLYAGFVETVDHYAGQLLEALEAGGLADNTLVILTSDNGGHPKTAYNRPFRGSKWNLYEGGIRVPLIVRWPGVVKPATTSEATIMQTDLMPTLHEIAGAASLRDPEWNGISLLPVLKDLGSRAFHDRVLTWHFPYYHPEGDAYDKAKPEIGIEDEMISRTTPQSAIRMGDDKLIYFYQDESVELYDLSADPGEGRDKSKENPALAGRLKTKLLERLTEENARFPEPNKK